MNGITKGPIYGMGEITTGGDFPTVVAQILGNRNAGNVKLSGTIDGTNWIDLYMVDYSTGLEVTAITAAGLYACGAAGLRVVRVYASNDFDWDNFSLFFSASQQITGNQFPSSGGGGSGTVTSVSVTTANGVSGSVANPTTTPAITLALGDITPSKVNTIALHGDSTPDLTVTGTASISGANTGDNAPNSSAVILAPNSAFRNRITPTGDYSNVILRLAADQTAEPFLLVNSSDQPMVWVDVYGQIVSNGSSIIAQNGGNIYTDNAGLAGDGELWAADGNFDVSSGGSVYSTITTDNNFTIVDWYNERYIMRFASTGSSLDGLYFDPSGNVDFFSGNSYIDPSGAQHWVGGDIGIDQQDAVWLIGAGNLGSGNFRSEIHADGSAKFASGEIHFGNAADGASQTITYTAGNFTPYEVNMGNSMYLGIGFDGTYGLNDQFQTTSETPEPVYRSITIYDAEDTYGIEMLAPGDGTGSILATGGFSVSLPYDAAVFQVADNVYEGAAILYIASAGGTNPVSFPLPGGIDVAANASVHGELFTSASTTDRAGLNIGGFGTAPTSPVDGDIWTDDASDGTIYIRLGGATYRFTLVPVI